MKSLALLLFALLLSAKTFAQQTDQEGIKQTINTLFDAMRKGDSTLLRSTFAKDIVFQSIANKKDGSVTQVTEKANDFIKQIGTPHKEIYDEQVTYKDIKVDGDLASVWAPYKFYLGKTFSHCGVDVFQLMKTKDGWKVIYIVDTRRKDNCPE
ncbi:nuclear transport factor 2 family protein [Mucilaginibacter sp. HC2]|uniref:nuclear transport factor 2 family protein n=1 Tax=Mucilaginibacter inviolabilis TaxID=2714892 RepID=UPI00140C1B91|nr:nuclear transport factor 2 family protein [Mucilaginibacter inviolabilis]NHA07409.1 nuclear transport factor 2 family protein [Mucilaginibacter inviolabilis]